MTEKTAIYTRSTGTMSAEISLEKNLEMAKAILNALPIEAQANKWGD